MKLTWFGHSAVELYDGKNRLWVDPFFTDKAPDWRSLQSPDLILVTHDHADHVGDALDIVDASDASLLAIADICYHWTAEGVPADKILFGGNGMNIGGTVAFNDVQITMTQAFHSSPHGVPVGFIVRFADGFTVYHAGDTGLFSDMSLLGERYDINVAILPMGGHFTMDSHDAAKACALLKAKNVLPIHYGTFPILAQDTNEFAQVLNTVSPKTKMINLMIGESSDIVK